MSNDSSADGQNSRTRLDFYHSPTQFRFDNWHRLIEFTSRLHKNQIAGRDITKLRDKSQALLTVLQTLEDYTAFPSDDDFELLWQLFNNGNYATLCNGVERIARALSSGHYRVRPADLKRVLDLKAAEERGNLKQKKFADAVAEERQKPYFEVLIVDKNAREEVGTLKRGFEGVCRPEDDFVYNIVTVPSFEDALIAVLFNYNIQACVLRYEFPLHSKNHLQILQRYLRSISELEYDDITSIHYGRNPPGVLSQQHPFYL